MTISDGIEVAPSIQFTKIWCLRNYASSVWTPQTQLVHVGGDELRSIYVATLKLKEIGLDVHFCIIAIAIKRIGSKG